VAPGVEQEPEVRLFVSVDIAGSTALKNRQNYASLAKSEGQKKRLFATVKEKLLAIGVGLSPQQIDEMLDDVLSAHLPSEEDLDWAAMLQNCFADFHTIFRRRLSTNEDVAGGVPAPDAYDMYPWKALGDELIYSFRVVQRIQIQQMLTHFIATLREYDEKLAIGDRIRLKGSAWVAGFPIRNRKIELPMVELRLVGKEEGAPYPYPRIDYLGPEMDAGFRLGRATWPSLCVVSVELAELLGECQTTKQIRLRQVGWEKMKGVWDDRPYPILWAELPPEHPRAKSYGEIKSWAEGESAFVKAWKNTSPQEAKAFLPLIVDLRKQLPPELGIVKPYIRAEGDPIPPEHESIAKLLPKQKRGVGGEQRTIEPVAVDPNASGAVERVVEETLKQIEVATPADEPSVGPKAVEPAGA
jgi:hypothetical protein